MDKAMDARGWNRKKIDTQVDLIWILESFNFNQNAVYVPFCYIIKHLKKERNVNYLDSCVEAHPILHKFMDILFFK